MQEVSLFRLYTLSPPYLLMAAGLAVYVWPAVIHQTNEFAVAQGIRFALLAGLGAAGPAHQIDAATADDKTVLMVVIVVL